VYRHVLLVLFCCSMTGLNWAQTPNRECAALKFEPLAPSKLLPMVKLSAKEIETISIQRACLKSYGYPGGVDALERASSLEIHNDLMHLKNLFRAQRQPVSRLSADDRYRMERIRLGWSREQVLLWGNFLYLQRLDEVHNFEVLLREVARIRREFGLKISPLTNWNEAEEGTYFSPQTLRNMIVALEYSAKGNLTSPVGPERDALVKAYLVDAPVFTATLLYSGNPGISVLGPSCEARGDHTNR
jgi:hypothetical protein